MMIIGMKGETKPLGIEEKAIPMDILETQDSNNKE